MGSRRVSLVGLVLSAVLSAGGAPRAQSASEMAMRDAFADGEAAGTILRQHDGGYVFVPRDGSGSLPVANPDKVTAAAQGLPLRARGRLTPDGATLELEGLKFELGPLPTVTGEELNPGVARNEAILREFAAEIDKALLPGALGDFGETAEQKARQAIDRIKSNCVDTASGGDGTRVKDPGTLEHSARSINTLVAKTTLGFTDVWQPWSYRRIFDNARSVVALSHAGGPVHCSGVLVADDLILTAAHCLADRAGKLRKVSEMQALFDRLEADPTSGAVGEPAAPDALKPSSAPIVGLAFPAELSADLKGAIRRERSFDRTLLDYVLLHVNANKVPKSARKQPLCRFAKSNRAQPLYVIGYGDGGTAQVYDNTHLFLPRQLEEAEQRKLVCELGPSLVPLVDNKVLTQEQLVTLVEQLARAYEPNPEPEDEFDRFLLFHPRYGGMPAMGLDPDTVGGVSGGPVYDHETHCIAGVFVGGMPDEVTMAAASWAFHEIALPVQDIRDQLKEDATLDASAREALLGKLTFLPEVD